MFFSTLRELQVFAWSFDWFKVPVKWKIIAGYLKAFQNTGEWHFPFWNIFVRSKGIKVPITPKSFFRLKKSLHLYETHCAFLPLLNPNIDLLQAVKVMKSGHHLSHDRTSKGYGSIRCLMSQTSLHACLQRLNTMQISLWHQTRNRPMPLTSLVMWQMMARFCNFYNVKKVKT